MQTRKLRNLKIKERQQKIVNELQEACLDRADNEKIVKKCNKRLDDLAASELFGEGDSD